MLSMATPHVSGSVALCISSGQCGTNPSPAQIIQKLRADAQTHADGTNGFVGDPNNPDNSIKGRYYGYLVWDGGY